MGPSTQRKTATSTRTPEAVGNKLKEPQNPDRLIPAFRKAIPLPQEVGESRRRAADHRPLAEAKAVGNPGRIVHEAPIAEVKEGVGEGVGAGAAAGPGRLRDILSRQL